MAFDYNAVLQDIKKQSRSVIFYHANCSDGITSAIMMALYDNAIMFFRSRPKEEKDPGFVNAYFNGTASQFSDVRANYLFVPYDYSLDEHDDVVVDIMTHAERSFFVDIVPSLGVIKKYDEHNRVPDGKDRIVRIYDHHDTSIYRLRDAYPNSFNYLTTVFTAPRGADGKPDMSDLHKTMHSKSVNLSDSTFGNFILNYPEVLDEYSAAGLLAVRLNALAGDIPLIKSLVNLALMVSDRDTWRFRNAYSKALHQALAHAGYFKPHETQEDFYKKIDIFTNFRDNTYQRLDGYKLLVDGVEEAVRNNVNTYASEVYVSNEFFWTKKEGGNICKVMICPMAYGNASYAGEYMYKELDADVAITYQDDPKEGIRRFSIRMDKSKPLPFGFNAKDVAEAMGGGGHDFASGVKRPINEGFSVFYSSIGNAIRDLIRERASVTA